MAESEAGGARRPAAEALLALNLVAARTALGWTQDALSAASGISRATIAQLETGVSDPRLSTLAALATAMGLPTLLLLIGGAEVRTLARLAAGTTAPRWALAPADLRQLQRWVDGGMLRDRTEAVRLAAQRVAAVDGAGPLAIVVGALFAAFLPDPGTVVGAAWGDLLASERAG